MCTAPESGFLPAKTFLFAVSCLALHFPIPPPPHIKMVNTFSPSSTQFSSSLWCHQAFLSCILAVTFHFTPFLVYSVSLSILTVMALSKASTLL